ncbi:MAG: hypothetical protein IPL57_08665 [Rubrivivax sp.]|nr:hypothetical protein [Rubrivivax sp.]
MNGRIFQVTAGLRICHPAVRQAWVRVSTIHFTAGEVIASDTARTQSHSHLDLRFNTNPRSFTMNHITTLAAAILSLAAAGSAFAESPGALPQAPSVSLLSRAAVQADVLQAVAAGQGSVGEAELNRAEPVLVARSRDAVRIETLAAIASGEAQALGAETNAFDGNFKAKRFSVTTRMAQAGR